MKKILGNLALGLVALTVLLVLGVLITVHTEWFRTFVRQEIVSAAEDATGGRVEVGSFDFDVSHLRAVVTNFVIHGKEPSGAAPFVAIGRAEVDFRLFTNIHHLFDVTYLGIDRPRANVVVLADGSTNIPSPKPKSASDKTPLEEVVDLAVGRFSLTNGLATVAMRNLPLNIDANNLRAQFYYNVLKRGYQGQLDLEPVYMVSGRNTPVTLKVSLPVALERDHIDIRHATVSTAVSAIAIDGVIDHMNNPAVDAHLAGHIATIDLAGAADVPIAVNTRGIPSEVDLDASAAVNGDSINIRNFNLVLGHSSASGSGRLKESGGGAGFNFQTRLAFRELARLMKVNLSPGPEDVIAAEGVAKVDAQNRIDLKGKLGHLDIQAAARAAGTKVPYGGIVSGTFEASGDMAHVLAGAHLAIAPGRGGTPLSGRLNAQYSRADGNVTLDNSWLALPHSRLDLRGSLKQRLEVKLVTRNLSDFTADAPVALIQPAAFTGDVTGVLSTPRLAGHLSVGRFSAEARQFDGLSADATAGASGASIRNAVLTRGPMEAKLSANVALRNWSPTPQSPLAANATFGGGDLADIMALAGEPPAGYSGALSATAQIRGTLGNPRGSANLLVTNGTIQNERFDRIAASVNLSDQLVTIPAASVKAGAGRIDLSGEFHHPRDSFTTGTVHIHVQSNEFALTEGTLRVNADANGALGAKEFLLTCIDADIAAKNLQWQGRKYGNATLSARTSSDTVSYNATSDVAGSNIKVNGKTRLVREYPTTADASVGNLAIERVLALANRTGIPASGILSATAHLNGTYLNPQGSATLDLSKAVVYRQALDRAHAQITYLAQSIDVPQLEVVAGPSRIDLTAHYDHPAGNLQEGTARFDVTRGHIDLSRVQAGVGGTVDLTARGSASIIEKEPRVLVSDLTTDLKASGIAWQGTRYGDVTLKASTVQVSSQPRLNFVLDSNLTGGTIHGAGNATLVGDYPVSANLTFGNLGMTQNGFSVKTDGQLTVSGPAIKTDQLSGSLQLSKLSLTAQGKTALTISNQGPVSVALDKGTVRVRSAHLTGRNTDIQVTGTGSIADQTVDGAVKASVDVGLAQSLDRDIYSSGAIALNATVRGTFSQPTINGQMTLQNAAFNYASLPVGLSNANGVVLFNGNTARVQNLTAEAGGGKITLSGFAGYGSAVRFGLRANASNVRVRVQEGVSVTAGADIRMSGTTDNSIVSGTATIERVNYAPHSDIGSILQRAAPPVQAVSAPSPLLDNMRLDIRVRTSSGLAVQASLAENLQADADLRIRGTASQPGVLGRVTITEGQLVFFGAEYTVDTGSISFYNPVKIDPILDVSLETQAKGVTVTLRVTGPIDNMKLSYSSDPPLQFQEIVGLLAAGSTPTSDPTILANQPAQPSQGFEQMGESAILGKAVADPVASRLSRVFGVSQLKIDPSFATGSNVPTASLSLQQRITNNLTFTYVSAINDPNSTIIRIEWAFNPQYSAVATRDQNGIFSINFFYKRQIR